MQTAMKATSAAMARSMAIRSDIVCPSKCQRKMGRLSFGQEQSVMKALS